MKNCSRRQYGKFENRCSVYYNSRKLNNVSVPTWGEKVAKSVIFNKYGTWIIFLYSLALRVLEMRTENLGVLFTAKTSSTRPLTFVVLLYRLQ